MSQSTPASLRLHVTLLGRRNAGKSSLLNALAGQEVAIVDAQAGTTTDPVKKAFELQPIGPVLFTDTAGLDDVGALGLARVAKTRKVIERSDLALVVVDAAEFGAPEEELLAELQRRGTPAIVALNKCDLAAPDEALVERARGCCRRVVVTSAREGVGIDELKAAIAAASPEGVERPQAILADLVGPGGLAVLVVPIDKEAPRGRLILPQVQSIRDLLDGDAMALVVKERELRAALERLTSPPDLVVTDSQAFLKVSADTPREIPMTSFSILFARLKGDLVGAVEGAMAIERLKPKSRVLIAEACSHHPVTEDIGRVKIPRFLTHYVGGPLELTHVAGRDFPDELVGYDLVIHCGACTFNRRAMLSRVEQARAQGVPMTNYGLAIAYSLGLFERALEPFPAAREAYERARSGKGVVSGGPEPAGGSGGSS